MGLTTGSSERMVQAHLVLAGVSAGACVAMSVYVLALCLRFVRRGRNRTRLANKIHRSPSTAGE